MKNLRQSENFLTEEDTFCENAQGMAIIMHEALLLLNFLHAKSQIENKNTSYYDL